MGRDGLSVCMTGISETVLRDILSLGLTFDQGREWSEGVQEMGVGESRPVRRKRRGSRQDQAKPARRTVGLEPSKVRKEAPRFYKASWTWVSRLHVILSVTRSHWGLLRAIKSVVSDHWLPVVKDTHICECTKNHWLYTLKWLNHTYVNYLKKIPGWYVKTKLKEVKKRSRKASSRSFSRCDDFVCRVAWAPGRPGIFSNITLRVSMRLCLDGIDHGVGPLGKDFPP